MDPKLKDINEPPPDGRSVRFAGEEGNSEILATTTESQRSARSAGSSSSSSSYSSSPRGSLRAGEGLRSNLMRKHKKDRDPLFYYEVLKLVGVGSMGSVSTVQKREAVVGGSARREIVESFKKQKKEKECFSIPLLGPLFMLCMKGTLDQDVVDSSHNAVAAVGGSKRSIFQYTGSCSETTATTTTTTDISVDNSEVDSSSSASRGRANMVYAMKSIHLSRVQDETFVEELKNEIEILKKLDHPHIVRPIETFFHRNQIFIVMELCSGGDLYSRDPYTEEEAARITSSILSAISYMHSRKVIHRDIKYENILFVNDRPFAEIKLIDFGLSKKYNSGEIMTEGVGTIYTMAPEVLKGSYTSQADVWSVGVVTYMLLSSQMPFYGPKRSIVAEKILKGEYAFRGRRWKKVSAQAKAFVEDLLVADPEDCPTAEEAAGNMWLNKRHGATVRAPTMDEVSESNKCLKAFAGYSKLKKLSLMVIAHKSTSEEIGILRKLFQHYDTDKTGCLSFDEFKAAMEQHGHSEEEVEEMFEAVDLDGTGKIRYTEFLAATIEAQGAISEERLAEAFDRLDSDDSGYISAENLAEMLGPDFPKDEIEAIIEEADLTKDNKIWYSEFLALWEQKNEVRRACLYQDIQLPSSEYAASLDSSSDDNFSSRSIKIEMEQDNLAENHTWARANYIDGKKLSERKHTQVVIKAH